MWVVYVCSLVLIVRRVCSLSFVCDLFVGGGFECEHVCVGMVLNVDVVNVGFAFEFCSLGRSSVCLNLGVEYDFFLIVDL